ncbi:class I tRNA ligase family protein [Kitasatospora aureofaciens]|uniref:class I tRNA ligase family protein n=1 Tax=Kitasatospora aureofaciens TaxID=1894 RepID=UPI001C436DF2|nr:class I tRNA ligase family protein [Kitasatospora aureofaciens]MBV6696709.1 class I tRNA ligase family protein [Kitasatospora aureofaciens]
MTGDRAAGPVVLLSPPPTPNGPLHLGHLSGPYLAADIAARAARARGESVLTVCGTDDHQNYVVAKAEQLGRKPDELVDEYGALIRASLAAAGIRHDVFTTPRTDRNHRARVARLCVELVTAGLVHPTEWTMLACRACGRTLHHGYVTGGCPTCAGPMGGGTCEACGGFATAAQLRDPRCLCGGEPRAVRHYGPVLRLEEYREALTRIWSAAVIPARVRALLTRLLAEGLPDVPVSYPTDWGIELVGGNRLDVWVEMGLAYLDLIGRRLDPDARQLGELGAAWRGSGGLWPFLGIDNAFYYAALFPALAVAAGAPWQSVLSGLVVNEFYRLDGLKFSTSRDHAVWAHELLATENPEAVRLFLSWDRPAPYPSNFTSAGYAAFTERWPLRDRPADPPARTGPDPLADAELARAEQALHPETFDPALAARCLLPLAVERQDARARRLLGALTGHVTDPEG